MMLQDQKAELQTVQQSLSSKLQIAQSITEQQQTRITELGISLDKLNWQNKEQNITITDLAEAVKREKQQAEDYLEELMAQKKAFGNSGQALFDAKAQIK